jgi:tetratricopeptide (TPR) repeat protein
VDAGPFVGRTAEVLALERLWTEVLETGSVRSALVVGEPGIGKSRLLGEARSRMAGSGAWLQGTCPPYGEAATFRAFAEVVRAHAGIVEGDGTERARATLAAAVGRMEPEAADRTWLTARLGPLVAPAVAAGDGEASASTEREELFGACERYLRSAAAGGPLVVALEDLHFAEPAMNALALHLAHALGGAPVLLVCTAREELLDRDDAWREAVARRDGPTAVRMRRLSDDEVGELVARLAGVAVSAETERALVDRAGGNPLFARELVRMVAETGGDADGNGVPDTVQAVVAARLDALPAVRRALVQTAAVVGDAFWPGAVAAVAGEEPGPVGDALDSLAERGLVREHQSTLSGEREFSFTHAVIRDVAYGQIPRRLRAKRHVAAALWLEAATGERAAVQAEALAHHYRVAVDLTRAAGGEPGEDVVAAARRFLALAGDRSAPLDAARATEYYLQALELAPAGDPDRAPALVAAARYGRRSGRVPSEDVVRMLEEASALFLERGDRAGAGEACLRLSMQLGARGQADRARAALNEGVALLEDAPEANRELGLAYATLGEDASLGGRFDEALGWSERALELPGTPETTIMALQVRGDARCSLGDLAGVEDIRRSVDIALREGLAQDAAVGHSWLAEWRWLLEGPEAGIEEERKGQDLGDRRGLTGATMWSRTARLGMLFDLGRWDELLADADVLLREDVVAGGTQITGLVLAAVTPVQVHRGTPAEALERLDEMLDAAREAQDLQFLLPALSAAVVARAAAGEPAAALALASEFHGGAQGRPTVYRELYGPAVVRTCLDAGDPDLAGRLVHEMTGASPRQVAAARTGSALLAAADGDHDAALAGFDEVAIRWRDSGVVVEEAFAGLGAARALASLGRAAEARRRAADAAARFRSLGASALAARADAVAAAPGG